MKTLLIAFLFSLSGRAFAQEASTTKFDGIRQAGEAGQSQMPAADIQKPLPKNVLIRLGVSSTTTGKKVDLRSMKTSGSDETGSMSESSSLPNLTYATFFGIGPLNSTSNATLIGMQSLNQIEDRTFYTRTGRQVVFPGQSLGLKLDHAFSEQMTIDAKTIYLDTYGILDPSMGLTYTLISGDSWINKEIFSLSVPTSEKSKKDNQFTRAFLRSQFSYRAGAWMLNSGISHAHIFFVNNSPSVDPLKSSLSGGGASRGVPGGAVPPMFNLSEVDLVLLDKEEQRTSINAGMLYFISQNLFYGASLGATLAETISHTQLWYTNIKLLDLTYRSSQWEIAGSLSLNSDIEKFKYVSLPDQFNAGIRLGYFYGNPDLGRR